MKKWLKKTLAIMLIAILMPVTSSFAVEENMTDFTEVNSTTTEEEIVKITKEDGLSVIGWSSYAKNEGDKAKPENVIDGYLWTIWHSDYTASGDYDGFDKERYLIFDLGKEYYLSKVIYYPRLSGYNGKFEDCDVYVSTDNSDWHLLKSEKNWANDTEPKEVVIENPTLARYVKVVGVNTYLNSTDDPSNINKYATAAEIEFYVKSTPAYDCMIERTNGNYYGSFADAVNNAQNGETVKLLKDVELSQAISINGKKITIDGHNGNNNFTINLSNPNNNISTFFTITGAGAKVIFDGVIVDGGAVWSENIDPTLQRGTENTGKAINSTFIYLFNRADLDIINGCILQNFDSNKFAGLIYASNTNLNDWVSDNININITDSTIRNNTITGNGTVIYGQGSNKGSSDINIKASEIYGNQNNNSGTADIDFGSTMYLMGYTNLYIDGGAIHNNDGGRYGGAAVAYGANVTVGGDALIEKNKAQRGGAFALTISDLSTLTLNDCTISQNNAEAEGGAVSVNKGVLNLNECNFNDNTSQGTGGAISMNISATGTVNLGNASFLGNSCQDSDPYGNDSRKAGNAIYYFGGTLNITGQPVLSENDDIYVEYLHGMTLVQKINIATDMLSENSIAVTPQSHLIDHVIAEIDPSIQDTVDRQAILKAFYFPKELNLDEKAVYIKENEIFYGDPVKCTKDIPQTMIKFTDEENPTYNFQLSVEATGTDITYKWYESDTVNGTYTLLENETKNTLNITGMGYGKKYYYCEIDNGELSSNGPYKSTICKVEVSEFYPCSQAVDKFERV